MFIFGCGVPPIVLQSIPPVLTCAVRVCSTPPIFTKASIKPRLSSSGLLDETTTSNVYSSKAYGLTIPNMETELINIFTVSSGASYAHESNSAGSAGKTPAVP
ncbi:hypothetical protein D3C84_825730 [compost metagenome]